MFRIHHLVFLLCIALFSSFTIAQPQKYTFDPSHTYVHWSVDHFGFSKPSGKWMAEGTLWVDEAKPEDSKFEVKIKLDRIVTGIPKFDTHLKSADFFEVAKYPIATFKSTKVTVTGDKSAKVTGTLNLHGITKPITLDVQLNRVADHPISNKKTAGFSATTTIKRSDFNLGKFAPGVSDDVSVEIEAEATIAE